MTDDLGKDNIIILVCGPSTVDCGLPLSLWTSLAEMPYLNKERKAV